MRSFIRLASLSAAIASTVAPPTTLLGGFLGAGKTTALTNMLRNRAGLKIAVLVNDVAAVNVDAQLLRRSTIDAEGVEMVELENGCVCCGPGAGGLAPAVKALAMRMDANAEAFAFDHIVVELSGVADPTNVQKNLNAGGVIVDRKVALVDANAFPFLYNSVSEITNDLAGEGQVEADPCAADRRVVELLLSQIETADTILVNKCDLATADELQTTLTTCRALNPEAKICSTTFGDAALAELLPLELAGGAMAGKEGDEAGREAGCTDPTCTDPTHAHEHSHDADAGCTDPTCTDPTHAHEHSHGAAVPNSAEGIGFETFVYRARRPFVMARLGALVQGWPLPVKEILTSDDLTSPGGEALRRSRARGEEQAGGAEFANVLRSKGTCWLDQQHRVMAEWSHAGRHFRLTPSGVWWATLPDPIMRACLAGDGADTTADTAAYRSERRTFDGHWGDRRQEIVFIGVGLDTDALQAKRAAPGSNRIGSLEP